MKISIFVLLAMFGTAIPAMGAEEASLYRPLSEMAFKQFQSEYFQLSACQKKYSEDSKLSPDTAIARIVSSGHSDQFLKDALRVLPAGDSATAFLKLDNVSNEAKIPMAMVGLAGYSVKPELLPVQWARAVGIVRKYFALATESACQPSDQYNKTLKVMLDANF